MKKYKEGILQQMKHVILFYALILSLILFSCGEKKDKNRNETLSTDGEVIEEKDLTSVSFVTGDIGKFPFYFELPPGYEYDKSGYEVNFNESYRFYNDSSVLTVGGKQYETSIIKTRNSREKYYNDSLIIACFDGCIRRVGGIEVDFKQDFKRNSYCQDVAESLKRYFMRTEQGNIWIELAVFKTPNQIKYSAVFEGSIREPIRVLSAERIRYALDKNGKVVLYFDFASGKSSLPPGGADAVGEIARLMQLDKDLKISIEGHTSNEGTESFCKRLSQERVNIIARNLSQKGINQKRIKTIGYGSEIFVVENNSDENRAKNRRIELVKINVDESAIKKAIEREGKAVLQISFESGKSIIKLEGMDIVEQIAKLMTSDKNLRLSVEGHTDNIGSPATNKKLSMDRANAIVNYLVDFGIDRKRLKAIGYGSEKPMVSNNTIENREVNRRVEIVKIN